MSDDGKLSESKKSNAYLVERMLPRGDLCIFFGPPGGGKTWAAADWVVSCLTDTLAMGKVPTAKVERVLWVNEDMQAEPMRDRLRKLCKARGLDPGGLNLMLMNRTGIRLDAKEGAARLKELVEQHKPDMVVFDSLAELMNGDPAKHPDVKKALGAIKDAQSTHPHTALVLAHTNRKGTFYGSQHQFAAIDVKYLFEREAALVEGEPDVFHMRREKSRNRRVMMGVEFAIEGDGIVTWRCDLDTALSLETVEDLITVLSYAVGKDDCTHATDKDCEGTCEPTAKEFVEKHRTAMSEKAARDVLKLACKMGLLKLRRKRGEHGLQIYDVTQKGRAWFEKHTAEEKPAAPPPEEMEPPGWEVEPVDPWDDGQEPPEPIEYSEPDPEEA